MLHYSFSTVFIALLASNLLVIIISICFLSKKILINTGYQLLELFATLVLLRLLLPFEFSFTANIILPGIPSKIISFFKTELFIIMNFSFSVWNLLECLWLLGILINIIFLFKRQMLFKNYIQKYGIDKTDDINYKSVLESICKQYKKPNPFRIIELPGHNVPLIFDLKNPCIVLPEDMSLSSRQLYYIFCHEVFHHFRHHLLIKRFIRVLSIIYWWNPFFFLLLKQVDLLLEMAVDRAIVCGNQDTAAEYAECLLSIIKNKSGTAPMPLRKNIFFFLRPHSHALTNRLTMLLQTSKPVLRICISCIVTVLVTGIYLASHLYILETHYPPLKADAIDDTSPETSYLVSLDSSNYEQYYDGSYIDMITDIHLYSHETTIYVKEGDFYIGEN